VGRRSSPAKQRDVRQRVAKFHRYFLCQVTKEEKQGSNRTICWHNFGTGAVKTRDCSQKTLIFKGFAASQPSVYLSEKTEDSETDAFAPRKRKNREEMGISNGSVLALPHL